MIKIQARRSCAQVPPQQSAAWELSSWKGYPEIAFFGDSDGVTVPFLDLHAQYLAIQTEIDAAMREVIASTAFISGPWARR